MTWDITLAFGEINRVLAICPCCGEVIRLTDARPFLKGRKLPSIVDKITAEDGRLTRAEIKLAEREDAIRDRSQEAGQRAARRAVRKLDKTFSQQSLSPADVNVIFDPVEYVVFDGADATSKVRQVVLVAHTPHNERTEKVIRSIERTIATGNYGFTLLRVTEVGQIERGE